jgi:hypothetical protein
MDFLPAIVSLILGQMGFFCGNFFELGNLKFIHSEAPSHQLKISITKNIKNLALPS